MPTSSLLLGVGTVISALSSTAYATKYTVGDSFNVDNWLEGFQFETYDKNNGFTNYVDEPTARQYEIYGVDNGHVKFGIDGTERLDYTSRNGRKSVRFEGKKDYNKGLFVLDVKTMPNGCGTWPAFWSLGREEWPAGGEIDIIEGVNANTQNKYVLHTSDKCKVNRGLGSGESNGLDCSVATAGPAGCDVDENRPNTFGSGFNNNHGGHYVMEWDTDAIKMWFFARDGALPASLTSDEPDTSEFGQPAAQFQGECDIEKRFVNHRFIFTNGLCGDWAGNVYGTSSCPAQKDANGKTLESQQACRKYVAEHPEAFADQFWRIKSFKTYNKKSVSVSSSSSHAISSTSMSSSVHSVDSAHVSSTASSSVHSSASVSGSQPSNTAYPSTTGSASVSHSTVDYSASSSSTYGGKVYSSSSVYGGDSYPSSTPVYDGDYYHSSAPIYDGDYYPSSTPVYGDYPVSTPVKNQYDDYAHNTPARNQYDDYAYSTPAKNHYDDLPSFTPAPGYPQKTSKATYGDDYNQYVSKTTATSTYTTTYVDVCETGYTTKTTTFAVTYCPSSTPTVPTPGKPNNPPIGWDVYTKVCNACEGPKTVTVTIPCHQCDYTKATPTPNIPNKPTCNGYDCKDGDIILTSKIFQTRVITLTRGQEGHKPTPPVYPPHVPSSKPSVPESKPPVYPPSIPSKPPVYPPSVPSNPPADTTRTRVLEMKLMVLPCCITSRTTNKQFGNG